MDANEMNELARKAREALDQAERDIKSEDPLRWAKSHGNLAGTLIVLACRLETAAEFAA